MRKVVKFIEGHNRLFLTPKKIQFLGSHGQVTTTQRRLIDTFGDTNINTSQLMYV